MPDLPRRCLRPFPRQVLSGEASSLARVGASA
jgi:hypothetical protein